MAPFHPSQTEVTLPPGAHFRSLSLLRRACNSSGELSGGRLQAQNISTHHLAFRLERRYVLLAERRSPPLRAPSGLQERRVGRVCYGLVHAVEDPKGEPIEVSCGSRQ